MLNGKISGRDVAVAVGGAVVGSGLTLASEWAIKNKKNIVEGLKVIFGSKNHSSKARPEETSISSK